MADFKQPDPVQDPLIWYREMVRHGLEEGVAPGLREQRDRLDSLPLSASQIQNLSDLDEIVLLVVTDRDAEYPPFDLLIDKPNIPLGMMFLGTRFRFGNRRLLAPTYFLEVPGVTLLNHPSFCLETEPTISTMWT